MGILDTLLGRDEPRVTPGPPPVQPAVRPAMPGAAGSAAADPDAQAVARYRYMLQTAPPETIEEAHAEAFERLTPEQRRLALQQLASVVPENERDSLYDDPRSMARAATRAEVRQPGILDRAFGGMGGGGMMGGSMMGRGMGMGMGGMLAGGLLTSIAGSFIGSSIAHSFFDRPDVINNFYETNPDMAGGNDNNSGNDNNNDYAGNDGGSGNDSFGGNDGDNGNMFASNDTADTGFDSGFDSGGDFGGGDFGGGDF